MVFDQSHRRSPNQSQLQLVGSRRRREIVRIHIRRGAEEVRRQLRPDERTAPLGLPVPNERLFLIARTQSHDHSVANHVVVRSKLRVAVRMEQRGPILRRKHAKQDVQHLPIPRGGDLFALIRHYQQALKLERLTPSEGIRRGTAPGGGRCTRDRKCLRETGTRSTQSEDEPPTDPAAWRGTACAEWFAAPACTH